jgi:TRAP-type C4-dicarboxylate transport system permease small subunit
MKFIDRIVNALYDKVFTPLLNALCLVMLVTTCVSVISRYVFHHAILWGPEASRFLFIFVIFIGTFLGMRSRKHISIGFVVDKLPSGIRRFVALIRNICMMVFFVFLIYLGSKFTIIGMSQSTQTLGISKGWIYIVIPLSAVFMFVFAFQEIIKFVRENGKEGEED